MPNLIFFFYRNYNQNNIKELIMMQLRKNIFSTGLLFILSISTCAGYDKFFPMSMIEISVPIEEKSLELLQQIPLYRFQLDSLNNKSSFDIKKTKYQLHYNENENFLLKIDDKTGEIWIDKFFHKIENSTVFIISAQNPPGSLTTTRAQLTITPLHVDSLEQFCNKNIDKLCFFDSILYKIPENDQTEFVSHQIGTLGPSAYRRLCPNWDPSYYLLNGTDYLTIKDNVIMTNSPLDHDTMKPGPNLFVNIQCSIKKSINSVPQAIEKIIEVAVLDRNDNSPEMQDGDGIITIEIKDPHVQKDKQVESQNIIFLDNDSLATNYGMFYEILNDTFEIFKPLCMGYEADHIGLKTSVINCKLVYARDGILRKSPYCIILRASDHNNSKNSANITICIKTDLSLIYDSDGPTALALQSTPPLQDSGRTRLNHQRRRKIVASADENSKNRETGGIIVLKRANIDYPSKIFVYKTATNLTRVAEPGNMKELIQNDSIKFKIASDPTQAFGITQSGGILYVRNSTALQEAVETIYYLTIRYLKQTITLEAHLHESINGVCQLNSTENIPSCSQQFTKTQCLKTCGIGVNGDNCQWRSNEIIGQLTINFATCSHNLTTCPDGLCDPLEQMGQTAECYICPQDCTNVVVGSGKANENKIGIFSANGICACDDFGKCTCSTTASTFSTKDKRAGSGNKKRLNSLLTTNTTGLSEASGTGTSTYTEYGITEHKPSWYQSQCGASCLGLIIGCPLLLVFVTVILFIARQKHIKKSNRKIKIEQRLAFGNNDTDTINIDVPLVTINSEFVFKTDPDSKWEFPRSQLILDIVLGEGEFGRVVKGYATDISDRPGVTTVAVKMLKTGAHSVELMALLSEFQLLQEVSHPNVIRLLGACTQGGTPLVIIEYAHHGSLKNYLRLSRKIECTGIDFPNGVEPVTVRDILSFAWQICKGMAYLTEIKLVHRDLAARNVLLAEGKVCKISDFGLTRDVYEDDAYLKRSKDRVPVKWMAPESLADHVYTSRSDVWAFGILAWELITLGASPYPGVPPQNLYHLLKQGYRMERPDNCSEQIYSIILTCWADDPISRPSFKLLASQWETLLGNNAKYIELEQNAISNPLYCSNDAENLSKPIIAVEEDNLDHLWYPPHSNSAELDDILPQQEENIQSLSPVNNNSIIPIGYDIPRPLINAKITGQKLRYQNDVRLLSKNAYINQTLSQSQKNLAEMVDHYKSPIKRGKSYIDMSTGVTNGFNNNLDTENIDKKISKDISFKFFSLLNINENVTSVM